MKIATVQIPNSTSIEKNFNNIFSNIEKAIKEECDLILFPECALSGFSAEIKKCTLDVLSPYLEKIKKISHDHKLAIIVPSSFVEESKIYNAIFIFIDNQMSIQYKIGLTESEKNFFSLPDKINNKVFNYQNKKIAILICFEAQQAPFKFFKEGEVDLILWPGYIHSGEDKSWGDCENQVFTNMKSWKVPLVQANFSHNDETIKSPSGPDGHSIILQKDNKLFKRGKFKEDDFLSVNLESLK